MIKEEDLFWSYFSGCVDCDGWITKQKREGTSKYTMYSCRIGLTQHNNFRKDMENICEELRGYGILVSLHDRSSNDGVYNTPMSNILISETRSVILCLEKMIPFLRFKKERAIEGLEYTREKQLRNPIGLSVEIPSTRKLWSEEDLTTLVRLHDDGYNGVAIANILKRSPQAINSKLSKVRRRDERLSSHTEK